MTTNATTHPWWIPLAWSAVFSAAGLSTAGFIGGLWLAAAGEPVGRAVSVVAVLVPAALAGFTWYASRARAERRWRVALDRYAEQEMAKGTHPRRWSHCAPHPPLPCRREQQVGAPAGLPALCGRIVGGSARPGNPLTAPLGVGIHRNTSESKGLRSSPPAAARWASLLLPRAARLRRRTPNDLRRLPGVESSTEVLVGVARLESVREAAALRSAPAPAVPPQSNKSANARGNHPPDQHVRAIEPIITGGLHHEQH